MSLIGNSKFENWYQAHPKATTGDKQLAREAYDAGMREMEMLREHMAKALIDNLHMLGYSGEDADSLWKGEDFKIVAPTAAPTTDSIDYAWECNQCGFQEYAMVVSEDDVHELGCSHCGGDEWHKEVMR